MLYCRIWHAIEAQGTKKAASTNELLGCTNDFLYKYIKSKFAKNMNWNNRRLWHIDHIIPCSNFDLSIPKEQKICFHYTNLQPIWSTTEIAKEMGEHDSYLGNQNKNDSGPQYDYFLEAKIRHLLPPGTSIPFAVEMHKRGVMKVF